MIVITTLTKKTFTVSPGDEFQLCVSESYGQNDILIRETIKTSMIINFVCSFRFALEDGTCTSLHTAGFFGNEDNLPKEIKEAKMLEDLTNKQQKNFTESIVTYIA